MKYLHVQDLHLELSTSSSHGPPGKYTQWPAHLFFVQTAGIFCTFATLLRHSLAILLLVKNHVTANHVVSVDTLAQNTATARVWLCDRWNIAVEDAGRSTVARCHCHLGGYEITCHYPDTWLSCEEWPASQCFAAGRVNWVREEFTATFLNYLNIMITLIHWYWIEEDGGLC
jgi:hypothetical protein